MNGSAKKTVLMIILALLAASAAFSLYHRHKIWMKASASRAKAMMPSFKPEDVREITVSWRDISTTLKHEDGKSPAWIISGRNGKQASLQRVNAMLNMLANLKPLKQIDNISPASLDALRLFESNESGKVPGISVSLKDASGREIYRIILGKGHFTKDSNNPIGGVDSKSAGGRYVLVKGANADGGVFLVSRLFENVHPVPESWIEQLKINGMDKALLIEARVRNSKESIPAPVWLAKRAEASLPFLLAIPENTPLSNQDLSNLAGVLSKPFSADAVTDDKPDMTDCTASLFVMTSDGFRYTLSLKPSGKNPDAAYATLQIEFKPENIRRLSNETDDEFATRAASLAMRYDYENRYYGNEVFVVPSKLISLIRQIPAKQQTKSQPAAK